MSNQKRGGHPMFYELGEEENNLYSAKHYQYATDADPMSNFRLCGQLIKKMLKPGVDPTIAAALCLMSKQIVGVYEIVGEGKTGTIESLEDKLKDIGIYSRIIRIIVRENDTPPPPNVVEMPTPKVVDGPYCSECGEYGCTDCVRPPKVAVMPGPYCGCERIARYRADQNNEDTEYFCDYCVRALSPTDQASATLMETA